ncbi:hypothetical protein BDR26DRAFT_873834 [Obelidium mucronatum]|nr:hypothetical protein BDR26DRAFT_873834 [Obelidium mucronatum]
MADDFETTMARLKAQEQELLAKNARLDERLAVLDLELKAKEEREARQLAEMQEKLLRIQKRAAAKEGFPFKFSANSTPLKDLQVAYRYLPLDVLPADQVELLDQAVEEGDISPLIDTFCEIANAPENHANMLLQALQNKASDHEDSPNAYFNDTLRVHTQEALAIGLMWQLV